MSAKVLVVVYGGVVQSIVKSDTDTQVEIIDLDNEDAISLNRSEWQSLLDKEFGNDLPEQIELVDNK